jgi:hypothetical protein
MLRFLAGAAACFLLMSGAFLMWQSRAAEAPGLPDAPGSTPGEFASLCREGTGNARARS